MLLSEQDLLKVCGCSYVGVGGGMSQCVRVKHILSHTVSIYCECVVTVCMYVMFFVCTYMLHVCALFRNA